MRIRVVILLILAEVFLNAPDLWGQQEALILPMASEGHWYISDSLTNEKSVEYTLLRERDMPELWRECVWLRIYPRLITLNVKQLFERFTVEIKPYYEKAKVTILERHTSFDTKYPYTIFTVESNNYALTGEPRSIMYYLIKGESYTFIAAKMMKVPNLSGKIKKNWLSFFHQSDIRPIPYTTAWKEMGLK